MMRKSLFISFIISLFVAVPAHLNAEEGRGQLRFVHAAVGEPEIDVWISSDRTFEAIPFRDVTELTDIPPGTYDIRVSTAGQSESTIASTTVDVKADTEYTLISIGKSPLIDILVIEDSQRPAPLTTQSQIRFLHLSPNAPTLDLRAGGLNTVFNEVGFKDEVSYIPLNAGTQSLSLQVSGTSVVALEASDVALEAGQLYTLYAIGVAGGEPALQLTPQLDEPIGAMVVQTAEVAIAQTEAESSIEVQDQPTLAEVESLEPEQTEVQVATSDEPIAEASSAESIDLLTVQIPISQQMLTEEPAPNTMPATGLQNNYQFAQPEIAVALTTREPSSLPYTALTLAVVILSALLIVGMQAAWPKPQTSPPEVRLNTPTVSEERKRAKPPTIGKIETTQD